MVQPISRQRFSETDLTFTARVTGEAVSVGELATDAARRDALLDRPEIFDRVVTGEEIVNLTRYYYFYVLVRHFTRDAGLDDRALADYLASLLAEALDGPRFGGADDAATVTPVFYVSDALQRIHETSYPQRFFLMARLADQTLLLTGIFPRYVERRRARRAAPGVEFYASVGKTHYETVKHHVIAQEFALCEIYDALSCGYDEVRGALNRMSRRGMRWGRSGS